MPELKGRRLPDGDHYEDAQPGDYWKPSYEWKQPNEWWIRDPFGAFGRITTHTVTEHDDGTITVNPSIAPPVGAAAGAFHGWLKAGVWTW